MSDLVGNPEDRFSHNEDHIKIAAYLYGELLLPYHWAKWSIMKQTLKEGHL